MPADAPVLLPFPRRRSQCRQSLFPWLPPPLRCSVWCGNVLFVASSLKLFSLSSLSLSLLSLAFLQPLSLLSLFSPETSLASFLATPSPLALLSSLGHLDQTIPVRTSSYLSCCLLYLPLSLTCSDFFLSFFISFSFLLLASAVRFYVPQHLCLSQHRSPRYRISCHFGIGICQQYISQSPNS